MKELGLRKLFQKLSNLGLETLELIGAKSNQNFIGTISELCNALLQLKGEAASVAIAEEILSEYHEAESEEKQEFFQFLYNELGVDHDKVSMAINEYQKEVTQSGALKLANACEASRLELLRTLNTAPNGTMALIEMREDLHSFISENECFAALDKEFLSLFQSWFNRGFLELRRIDWNTPALILEKLIQYESVHEIKGWPDLRRRLAHDRGCFGFFHPAIPNVPLIFVEAALTQDISTNVTALLQQDVPDIEQQEPNTAVFYSINNCLQGLRGVSFGNFLIKQVIEKLSAEVPSITQFVTLSPVPGFMRWLQQKAEIETLLNKDDAALLKPLLVSSLSLELIHDQAEIKRILTHLCAYYLVQVKSRGKPANAVARFHIGNGARLEQINWMADTSSNGMEQAAGIMVNYVYDSKQLARNHEAYEQRNEVAHSASIRKHLQKP